MVNIIKRDTLGNPVVRKELPMATCPVCEQDVDVNNKRTYIVDENRNCCIHKSCIDRLNNIREKQEGKEETMKL